MAKKAVEKPENNTLRVTCKAAGLVEVGKLTRLQGDLKTLSAEDRARLRASLEQHGVSFPIHAWKDGDRIYILDGTQRSDVIKEMAGDKFKVPVAWIEAKNKNDAAKKLLAAASQYGEVTSSGLIDFMKTFKISLDELKSDFRFPEINIPKFEEVNFFAKIKEKELDENIPVNYECPSCGYKW